MTPRDQRSHRQNPIERRWQMLSRHAAMAQNEFENGDYRAYTHALIRTAMNMSRGT